MMQTEWQTGAVWSGSTLIAQAYLFENIGPLRYLFFMTGNQDTGL